MIKPDPMAHVNVTHEHKIGLMHIAQDNYFQGDEKSSILEQSSHVRSYKIYMSNHLFGIYVFLFIWEIHIRILAR